MAGTYDICTLIESDEHFPVPGSQTYAVYNHHLENSSGNDDEIESSYALDSSGIDGENFDEDSADMADCLPPVSRLSILNGTRWNPGETITILLLPGMVGTAKQIATAQTKIMNYSMEWMKYANIKFKFVRKGHSDVRISFRQDAGWWSKLGTQAKKAPQNEPTMNLAVTPNTSDTMLRRHVLHEFGHVLGCIHEHSSPGAEIPWNKAKVYEWYARQGWDKKKVDYNLFYKYNKTTVTQFSKFDRTSIMMYPIDQSLTTNHMSIPWNMQLSAFDKRAIKMAYPPKSNHPPPFINIPLHRT